MDIRTRPKRRRKVIAEPHETYAHYLPVALMERFREQVESEQRSYSEAMTDAVRLFLATKTYNENTNIHGSREGGTGD